MTRPLVSLARSLDLNQNGRNIKRNAFFLCHAFSRQCYCVLLHSFSVCLDFVVLYASVYLHDLKCLESLKKIRFYFARRGRIHHTSDRLHACALSLSVQVTICSTLFTGGHRPRRHHRSTSYRRLLSCSVSRA